MLVHSLLPRHKGRRAGVVFVQVETLVGRFAAIRWDGYGVNLVDNLYNLLLDRDDVFVLFVFDTVFHLFHRGTAALDFLQDLFHVRDVVLDQRDFIGDLQLLLLLLLEQMFEKLVQ